MEGTSESQLTAEDIARKLDREINSALTDLVSHRPGLVDPIEDQLTYAINAARLRGNREFLDKFMALSGIDLEEVPADTEPVE